MNWGNIFNVSLIYATIRSATPLIYAALCAAITQQANILNVGTEGIMLTGAFFAVAGSYLAGSWVVGVLVAMISGLLIAMIMAVGHIKFNADITAIGMGINLFALAVTKFLLNAWLKQSGTFSDPAIKPIPKLNIPGLQNVPVIGEIFNNWAITEILVFFMIFVISYVIYKTAWGLRLRAVGQFAQAAQTAGIKVNRMKYEAMALSGLLGGLAGAHLSLGYSRLFTENMTSNRGFMGVAAMFFGGADPLKTALACLVFGFADSVGARLQPQGIPSQIVLLMPYLVTVIVLAISMYSRYQSNKRRQSSLLGNTTK